MSGETARPATPPSPPSPSASFYDMSDDEEGEYNTIRHTRSERGVKLLFSKSKVYVHPTASERDNIPGFVALLEQKASSGARPTSSSSAKSNKSNVSSSLLLAWIPENTLSSAARETYVKVDLSDSSSPPTTSYLVPTPPMFSDWQEAARGYAFSIPVSNIYSIQIEPPSRGWYKGNLTINTKGGVTFPKLFFHDDECQSTILQRKKLAKDFDPFGESGTMFWGGDEVLRWLKRYIEVERSASPSIYLLEPNTEDRLNFGKSQEAGTPENKKKSETQNAGPSPLAKNINDVKMNLLTAFARVPGLVRTTRDNIIKNAQQAAANMAQNNPHLRQLLEQREVQRVTQDFDAARIYLANWAQSIAEQSERDRRQREFSAKELQGSESTALGSFELVNLEAMSLEERRNRVKLDEWKKWFDAHGRLTITPDEVKERIFHGGLDRGDGVRKEAWLFLLGVYDWNSSLDERKAMLNSKRDEYYRLKSKWWEKLVEGACTPEQALEFREQKNRIEKDVHRTDRTIPIFEGEDLPHPDRDSPFAELGTNIHMEQLKDILLTYNEYRQTTNGYVQGMSDLLAPIYAVLQDDALSFWAFAGFMERMERNFLSNQSGMKAQLLCIDRLVQFVDPALHAHLERCESTNFFFFFRMILIWFKREFEWDDILSLWERLWTDWLSGQFVIFFAVAILEKYKPAIEQLKAFDEVLKYINDLSGNINLEETLVNAEKLFLKVQRKVEEIDREGNFPAPSNLKKDEPSTPASPPKSPPAGANKGKQPARPGERDREGGVKEVVETKVVVSPEVRALLSRKSPRVDKKDVV